jgi:predicted MPP superfamily phosphohydrolase
MALINWSHSLGLPRRIAHGSAIVLLAWVGLLPVLVVLAHVPLLASHFAAFDAIGRSWLGAAYFAASCMAGGVAIAQWIWRRFLRGTPRVERSRHEERVAAGAIPPDPPAQNLLARLLLSVPGNQMRDLRVTHCEIEIPRLDPSLDGLSVVHLSDIHLTGLIDRSYFEYAAQLVREWSPDLVAVTGDLVDDNACLDWLPDTLGRLEGRFGAYFILGNHDHRVDSAQVRRILGQSGLIDLGGRWIETTVRGQRILLAGNETPWFASTADLGDAGDDGGPRRLRIALCHSPDQFGWARANDVDLVLCGHTHGGQICLPGIGPLLVPSRFGVRYAGGTFHREPTVMCVQRGLSAEVPIRLFCPPEIVRLALRASPR